mgnify:CR=1 FL=1|tara:strand:- start:6970 stop:8487 length:1518 start_codon:yes stop_codon:yes gene_type:complete
MAQPLQSINLVAPAFQGINTEDSPLAQDTSFAEVADNAIIDRQGRLASRQGNSVITTNKTALGTDHIHNIHEFYDSAGNETIFSTGNNKIMSGTTTLTDVTPGSYTITANDWKIVNFNDKAYFFQRGFDPLVHDNSNGLRTFTVANGGATNATFKANEVLAAFGRLFIAGNATNDTVIYWSDLLDGNAFTGGSSGNIDVAKAWPNGSDKIVALAAHNDFLIVFGEHSIIVYSGASSPASMAISDTVSGVGCIDRKTVQNIGIDLLFLSDDGLRSLGRVIQEKSLPITDASRNIKQDLIAKIKLKTSPATSVYSPENYFYLLGLPDSNLIYCFDLRGRLENGSFRVTKWPSVDFKSFARDRDGTVYIGTTDGIGKYDGYDDNNSSFIFRYSSPGLTFGDASKLKLLKKIRPTIVGGNDADIILSWTYDFSIQANTSRFKVGTSTPGFYGESEYTQVDFTLGDLISRKSLNCTGNGSVVSVGLQTEVNGNSISLQEMNVLALIGKTV